MRPEPRPGTNDELTSNLAEGSVRQPSHGDLQVTPAPRPRIEEPTRRDQPAAREITLDDEQTTLDAAVPTPRAEE